MDSCWRCQFQVELFVDRLVSWFPIWTHRFYPIWIKKIRSSLSLIFTIRNYFIVCIFISWNDQGYQIMEHNWGTHCWIWSEWIEKLLSIYSSYIVDDTIICILSCNQLDTLIVLYVSYTIFACYCCRCSGTIETWFPFICRLQRKTLYSKLR